MHLTAAQGLIMLNVKKLIVLVYECEHFRCTMLSKIGGCFHVNLQEQHCTLEWTGMIC
jgi:hypothetical protein